MQSSLEAPSNPYNSVMKGGTQAAPLEHGCFLPRKSSEVTEVNHLHMNCQAKGKGTLMTQSFSADETNQAQFDARPSHIQF